MAINFKCGRNVQKKILPVDFSSGMSPETVPILIEYPHPMALFSNEQI